MKTFVSNRPIIAVTGSSGKTTTKEMIAAILRRRWKIFNSKANRNSVKSIARYVKQIRSSHQAIVFEYGMSGKGQLKKICQIIQPNMAVITMVGTAHIGNFGGSIKGLINAKSEIIVNMNPSGTLFLNADDSNSGKLDKGNFTGKVVTVGIREKADYQAVSPQYVQGGMSFKVKLHNCYHDFFIPVLGIHNVYNALFAIAVADHLGFTPDDISKGLRYYLRPKRRLTVYRLKKKVNLIDDTYNSNPNSVKAAIDVLNNIDGSDKMLVLGDMSALGLYSNQGVREVGTYIANSNITHLFTFGKQARKIGQEAIKNGFSSEKVIYAGNRKTLHKRLKSLIREETTILVKGSHNTGMYITVNFLRNKL